MSKRLLLVFGAAAAIGIALGMLPLSWRLALLSSRSTEDGEDRARVAAFQALVRTGPAAVPTLCDKLAHPDPRTRREAAYALYQLGEDGQAAIPTLSAALDDEDSDVRRWAVSALGSNGPAAQTAVPALSAALKDKSFL